VVRVGVGQSHPDAADAARLSDRDLQSLALLADGRAPVFDKVDAGGATSGEDARSEVQLILLDPRDPDFDRKASAVRGTAAAGKAILVFAPGLSAAQAESLGNVGFVDELASTAIKDEAARRGFPVERLDVRFFSKTDSAFNVDIVALVDQLKNGFTLSMHLSVLLANTIVSIPVTRGELERMLVLEENVRRLVASQA
jgi:hypothetical protein